MTYLLRYDKQNADGTKFKKCLIIIAKFITYAAHSNTIFELRFIFTPSIGSQRHTARVPVVTTSLELKRCPQLTHNGCHRDVSTRASQLQSD